MTRKYPYYGATGILDYVDEYIFDEKLVLVGEDGAKWNIGDKTAFIADGKYWVNNHAHVLRPNREKLLDDYLIPILNSQDLSKYVTGITVPKLNQAKLKSIKIPLPPLSVQKEIVDQIEVKQNAINHAKEIIKNLERERRYFGQELRKLEDVEMVELGKVAEIISGQSPESKYCNKNNDGLPFYQGKTEFTNRIIENPKYWTTKTTKVVEKDDILMSVRAPVGPVNFTTQKICIGRGLAAIRVNKKINPIYLFIYLQSIQDEIKGNGGAVFDSINRSQIEKIKIPIPLPTDTQTSMDIQSEIVEEIEWEEAVIKSNKKMIEIMEQKIEKAINLMIDGEIVNYEYDDIGEKIKLKKID